MTWCILLHTYTYESRSRTPKRIRIYSVIYYIIHIHIIIRCNTSPGGRVICHKRRRLAPLLPRVFSFISKRTLKRPVFFNCSFSAIHRFPSLFFVTFWLFRNTSLGKKKQAKNMQHRSSNADTIRAESEKVRQANEERLREKRMVRRRLISFFSKLSLFVTFVELFD